jgi:hypothetical protein
MGGSKCHPFTVGIIIAMKHKAKVFLFVAGLLGGIVFLLTFFVSGHAVPKNRFDQVKVGMTEVRVQEILGVPQGIRHNTADSTVFGYGGFLEWKWCTMQVFFGANGRVTGKFHDH